MATANNTHFLNKVAKIAYGKTGFFSQLVIDFLNDAPELSNLMAFSPTREGLKNAVLKRREFACNRRLLVSELKKQYRGMEISGKTEFNLNALENENCFTITTAHQPNIFTGPLYFVYKILHAVKLAEFMQTEMPDYYFVPVFYMGSEDADLEELGHITINGVNYQWQTKQTGTVGRMMVDDNFLSLISQIHGQLGVLPEGNEIVQVFKSVYTKGKTIQQATLELVNHLFSEWGVIVLNPDNENLKRAFEPVVKKELQDHFSHSAVSKTIAHFPEKYKVQASGREINLFYLLNDRRERIEWEDGKFLVKNLDLEFSQEAILIEVEEHPDRFSGNVILRGVFQESILPNIAFIGGGGELAYWLELKKVFEEAQVFYPVLILRNSFLLIEEKWMNNLNKLGINENEIFLDESEILKNLVFRKSENSLSISSELAQMKLLYEQLDAKAAAIDKSLQGHVMSLQKKSTDRLESLEKKMIRAEKRKFETEQRQLKNLKTVLFPNDSLQERVENFSGFYAIYGREFLKFIFKNSPATDAGFSILQLPDNQE